METYEINLEQHRPNLKHKLIAGSLYAVLFFGLRCGCLLLWPMESERNRGFGSVALQWAVVSILWGFSMAFLTPLFNRSRNAIRRFQFLVDADCVTAVYNVGLINTRRSIRKGQVKSIFRVKGSAFHAAGTGISERSMFAARILGFVFIPDSLPESKKLKALAESWRIAD